MLANMISVFSLIFIERKDPTTTWAWLLILMLIPGIGFIIYLLFLFLFIFCNFTANSVINKSHSDVIYIFSVYFQM